MRNYINHKYEYLNKIETGPLKILLDERIFVGFDQNKKPYDPKTVKGAKCNDPKTWGTFEEVSNLYLSNPKIQGIGVEFGNLSNGKKLAGIDIDDCINENGEISAEASELIEAINSYTEYSPRWRGIHILFYMDQKSERLCNKFNISDVGYTINTPDKWCSHIEFYNVSHYFTITGKEFDYEKN